MFRLWKGFQIQASFKGKLYPIFAVQIWIDIYLKIFGLLHINISRYLGISDITYVYLLFHRPMFFMIVFLFYFLFALRKYWMIQYFQIKASGKQNKTI